jgi:hypothetical protein
VVVLAVAERRRPLPTPVFNSDEGPRRAGLPSTSALLPAARRHACFGSAAGLRLWWLGTGLVEVTWDDGGVGASRGEVVGGEGRAVGRRRRRLSCCSAVVGLQGAVLGPAQQRAWYVSTTASGRQLPTTVEDGLLWMVVPRLPCGFAVPTLSTSQGARWVSLHGRESTDARAAALGGGLHGRLDGRAALRW